MPSPDAAAIEAPGRRRGAAAGARPPGRVRAGPPRTARGAERDKIKKKSSTREGSRARAARVHEITPKRCFRYTYDELAAWRAWRTKRLTKRDTAMIQAP